MPKSADDEGVRTHDTCAKLRMKQQHDKSVCVKPSPIAVGDSVIIRNTSLRKTTPYNLDHLRVVSRKGSMVTARRGERAVTRNISFFKRILHDPAVPDEASEDEEPSIEACQQHMPEEMPQTMQQASSSQTETSHTACKQQAAQPSPRPVRVKRTPTKFKDFIMG